MSLNVSSSVASLWLIPGTQPRPVFRKSHFDHLLLPNVCTDLVTCSCLSHVTNLAICDFMAYITKIAVIENKQAVWDYDPSTPDNRIFGRDLDVIAVIRTLAVKVRALPQASHLFSVSH
ncbi:hypothetical protein BV25DRAFT_1804928 [Artomyces pyxidatus]|uniref:Uncharacterized protein n=1 Tax=Artomyces pyxidatus TaxID=48021 RepID=A0ACB8T091_9AGAM|nr:hypothetical protein BV25DRAFT_1804928 [Artomyces pyxidatus]